MDTLLIVGLGNPGVGYAATRHNVGFMAADAVADALDATPWTERHGGLVAEATVGATRVVLLKPVDATNGINGSGTAVRAACDALGVGTGRTVVVHDEMAIAPGEVRAKVGGGDAGHNGLKSVTAHVGPDYARVRVGIGHPGTREAVMGHVLGEFGSEEKERVDAVLAGIVHALPELVAGRTEDFLRVARDAVAEQAAGASPAA